MRESLTLYFGDLSGFLALIFISATAVLMVGKRKLSKTTGRNVFFKRIHIIIASLGGGFLLIHADYFIGAPLDNWGILLGYIATAAALFVWFSGFAFLERLSDSLRFPALSWFNILGRDLSDGYSHRNFRVSYYRNRNYTFTLSGGVVTPRLSTHCKDSKVNSSNKRELIWRLVAASAFVLVALIAILELIQMIA